MRHFTEKDKKYLRKRIGTIGIVLDKFNFFNQMSEYEYMVRKYYSRLDPGQYPEELDEWYQYKTGRPVGSIEHPVTFNDKINYLKLRDNIETRTLCADKYAVRQYIADIIGEEYLIPLLGCWEDPDKIDLDVLPGKFVLKSNTGSGRIRVVEKEKLTTESRKSLLCSLRSWQKTPIGYAGMEVQYLNIPRKIIAEQFISNDGSSLPFDYKFHCFHGIPLIVEYLSGRSAGTHSYRMNCLTVDFRQTSIRESGFEEHESIEKPVGYEKMVQIARTLSAPFTYVRVDLYNIRGKIYFGELTFTPCNGYDQWDNPATDELIGRLLEVEKPETRSESELLQLTEEFFVRAN